MGSQTWYRVVFNFMCNNLLLTFTGGEGGREGRSESNMARCSPLLAPGSGHTFVTWFSTQQLWLLPGAKAECGGQRRKPLFRPLPRSPGCQGGSWEGSSSLTNKLRGPAGPLRASAVNWEDNSCLATWLQGPRKGLALSLAPGKRCSVMVRDSGPGGAFLPGNTAACPSTAHPSPMGQEPTPRPRALILSQDGRRGRDRHWG